MLICIYEKRKRKKSQKKYEIPDYFRYNSPSNMVYIVSSYYWK